MASLVWLGVVLAVFASMVGTVGKQLFRFSEMERVKGTRASLFASKVALAVGLALNVLIGPLLDMSSYAFAPQGVIAPLAGLDVVWNTMSAPITLGESLTRTLVFGCAMISAGATATSFFGSHEDKEYTPEMLKDLLTQWRVGAYLGGLALWLAFNIFVLMQRSAAPKGEPFKTGDMIRGLSLGMTAGSIAGNMFCVKAFVELVQASINGGKGEYWLDWLPYCLFIGALFFATSNLYFLQRAMREYEALFMGAVFEGSVITAACISGSVVFDELAGQEAWQVALYWLAVGMIIGGIATVCKGCMSQAESVGVVTDVVPTLDEESEAKHAVDGSHSPKAAKATHGAGGVKAKVLGAGLARSGSNNSIPFGGPLALEPTLELVRQISRPSHAAPAAASGASSPREAFGRMEEPHASQAVASAAQESGEP